MAIGWKVDVPGAERFFERSPFRWWPLITDTILFFMILSFDAFILIRYWTRLPGPMVISLLAVALGMWLLWRAATTAHRRIHEIHTAGMFGEIVPRSPVESVIRVAASMIHLGLFSAFVIAGILFIQIDRLLSR